MLAVRCRQEGVSNQGQIVAAVGEVMGSPTSLRTRRATALLPALPVVGVSRARQTAAALWRRANDALRLVPPAYAYSPSCHVLLRLQRRVRTATFNGCTVGANRSVDGSVNLTFSDAAVCQRSPPFG